MIENIHDINYIGIFVLQDLFFINVGHTAAEVAK